MLSYIFNQLYKKVGQLKIEVDWLKIKSGYLSIGESQMH